MALDRINLFNVDRIEIASGPASALYGSDAMGGVINIITLTPEKPEVTVGLEAGSETTANWWHADTGRIGKFSASFDARFDKYRRDLLPDDDLGHGNDTSQNYNAALQYELDEDSRIRAWSDYFSEHMKSGSSDAFTSRDYRQKNYGLSWEEAVRRTAGRFPPMPVSFPGGAEIRRKRVPLLLIRTGTGSGGWRCGIP